MKNFYEQFDDDPEEAANFADECPILEDFDDDLVKSLGPKQAANIVKKMEKDCSSVDLRSDTLDPQYTNIDSDWY